MRGTFLSLFAITFVLSAKAQTANTINKAGTDTLVYDKHNFSTGKDTALFTPPGFLGGDKSFIKFLVRTVRYPAVSRENNEQGKVILQMVVEKDGSITGLRLISHVSNSLDAEALRVIKFVPKWQPGVYDGKPVRSVNIVPLSFTLATN